MRNVFILAVALGLAAQAGELRLTTVQGANIRTWFAPGASATASATTGNSGMKLSIQCPNVDGGAGQKVHYRAGCLPTTKCAADAGVGDVIMDFTAATGVQDPYKVDLAGFEDRVYLASEGSYAVPLYCHVFRRQP